MPFQDFIPANSKDTLRGGFKDYIAAEDKKAVVVEKNTEQEPKEVKKYDMNGREVILEKKS